MAWAREGAPFFFVFLNSRPAAASSLRAQLLRQAPPCGRAACQIRVSMVVGIPACRAEGLGSIPVAEFFWPHQSKASLAAAAKQMYDRKM